MDHSQKSTYHFAIDALRVIAILAVILIHVTTDILARLELNVEIAPFTLFLNQVPRFAVPLFFLISGFVLELNYKNSWSFIPFFKKRASRILIPYLFWSSIYFFTAVSFTNFSSFGSNFLKTVLFGTASYHLYFIPTLILFYAAFPFFHKFISILKKPLLLIPVIFLEVILLSYDYYVSPLNLNYDVRVALLSFVMFLLGMISSHNTDRIYKTVKKHFFFLLISLVFLILFIYFHVYSLTLQLKTSRFIYNQYSPLNYLYTLLLGSFLFYFFEKTQFAKKTVIKLSKLSFFVFFIHVFILKLIWEHVVDPLLLRSDKVYVLQSAWFDIFLFLTVTLFSFGIAFLIHKIPNASKLTG